MDNKIREYKVIDRIQAGTSTVLVLDKDIDWGIGDHIMIDGKKYQAIRNSIDSWIVVPNLTLDYIPDKVGFEP